MSHMEASRDQNCFTRLKLFSVKIHVLKSQKSKRQSVEVHEVASRSRGQNTSPRPGTALCTVANFVKNRPQIKSKHFILEQHFWASCEYNFENQAKFNHSMKGHNYSKSKD